MTGAGIVEKPRLARDRSRRRVIKLASWGQHARRRGSIGASLGSDPELSLILQNSGVGDELSYPLRRIHSESDASGLRRRSLDSLQSLDGSNRVTKVAEGQALLAAGVVAEPDDDMRQRQGNEQRFRPCQGDQCGK